MPTKIFFTSDAHFGHKNVANFGARPISNHVENQQWISDSWIDTVRSPNHIVYCLGDMTFDLVGLKDLSKLPGRKILVRGNHEDRLRLHQLAQVYEDIQSMLNKYGYWITHPPIHPNELRGRFNVHGHVHTQSVADNRYFNLCPENLHPMFGRPIISLEELREWTDQYYSPLHA